MNQEYLDILRHLLTSVLDGGVDAIMPVEELRALLREYGHSFELELSARPGRPIF